MVLIDTPFFRIVPVVALMSVVYYIIDALTGSFGYETPDQRLRDSYDFIVVGGGTTGCVVASRLSENGQHSVLLLEVGPGYSAFSNLAMGFIFAPLLPNNYQYKAVAQGFNCQAFRNGECNLQRGGGLGGSSNINAMVYTRANPKDYDKWERMGNPGWSYKDVLQYFKKSENNLDPVISSNTEHHSTDGPVYVSSLTYRTPIGEAWVKAGQENGYVSRDYNAGVQTVVTNPQFFMNNTGFRSTASRSFLKNNLHRPNFHISTYSRVDKILINHNKRAYGVEVTKDGRKRVFLASKEVILTAGAFETPKLMKLSGIGPKKELDAHRIPVVKDLPVGLDMIGHFGSLGYVWTVVPKVSWNYFRVLLDPFNIFSFLTSQTGILTSPSGLEGIAYMNTKYQNASEDWPDMEIILLSTSFAIEGGLVYADTSLGIRRDIMKLFRRAFLREAYSLYPSVNRPKSRGKVLLRSGNPADEPLLIHNAFQHPDDMKIMIEAVKIALKLGNSQAFKEFGAEFVDYRLPACSHVPAWSDAYIECQIRQLTYTLYHDVGTAKMGPKDAGWATVDPQLRVYGIKGLRVADISIMPDITSGNTNAPAYMIAEKASDMIKDYWRKKEYDQDPHKGWPDKTNNDYEFELSQ